MQAVAVRTPSVFYEAPPRALAAKRAHDVRAVVWVRPDPPPGRCSTRALAAARAWKWAVEDRDLSH